MTHAVSTSKSGLVAKLMHELTLDRSKPEKVRMPQRDLANMFNMLCTLLDNGMPLQKALAQAS